MKNTQTSAHATAAEPQVRRRNLRTWVSDSLHDLFFEVIALPGKTAQKFILDRVFAWKYRVHDPWSLRSSAYEQTRYQRMLDLLPDRAYPRVLELGCAEGAFTHKLADAMAGAQILGVDNSIGSLAPGKAATLIVTTDTPLELTSAVTSAFINGRSIDLSSKHTKLNEKYRERYKQMGLIRA